MQKRVLFITYHYPPILSAGVSRLVGMTKYLARAGWRCTVVTVKRSYAEESDDASLGRIAKGISVIRTSTFEADRFNPRRMLRDPAPEPSRGRNGSAGGRWARKLLVSLMRYPYAVFHLLAAYPERQAGWCIPLLMALKRALDAGGYDVVVSSSPPHSTHVAVWCLRKVRRFRWVADFRDPWTAPPHYGKTSKLAGLTSRIERLVLGACDRVVANTPGNRACVLRAFPFLDERKVAVVTNGYDDEDSGGQCEVAPEEVDCDLIYTGEVYARMLDLYIEALNVLREDGAAALPRLYVYGTMERSQLDAVRAAGFGSHIVFKGRVTLGKSTALMRSAPALLLTVAHNQRGGSWVPSKTYGYLFADKPILAIVPEGDAADLIEATGAGTAVTSADPRVVAGELMRFLSAVGAGTAAPGRREEVIRRYRMEAVAARMGSILEDTMRAES